MEIKWHGNTCFSLGGENTSVVINPHKEGIEGEIVLSSLLDGLKPCDGQAQLVDWPGEYEFHGIPILAFSVFTAPRSKDDEEQNLDAKPTIVFYFEIDKIKCCHLGGLGHKLKSEILKEISDVDVLMIDAGPHSNLDLKKADEIIEALDPRVLIAMGENMEDFKKAHNMLNIEPESKVDLKKGDLPDDQRLEIVLKEI